MHLTVATAGHIDHGKSALVQALTGTNPDRLKEEQARGISIELGFAHTQVGATTLSFVDVPGHERFVRTMLAGVGGIDAVLLVVAADESVMPQTREHMAICRLLDVPSGVVALSRCDLADESMQAVAEDEVRTLLAGSALAHVEIVRTSTRTGEGLDRLREALVGCAGGLRPRDPSAPARLPIDRVFTMKGFGTVATGTLWSGTLAADRTVSLIGATGAARDVRIRGVHVHGMPASGAVAGQRTAVNLAGVAHQDVSRGDVLVEPGAVVPTRRLLVDLTVLPDAAPVRHGARVHVHLGTSAALARVIVLRGADAAAPRVLPSGAQGRVLLRLETPLPSRRGDRLVLRTYSPVTTVAGGVVDDPLPPLRLPLATTLAAPVSPSSWLRARISAAGLAGVPAMELPARCGVSPALAEALVADLAREGAVVRLEATLVSSAALPAARERVLQALAAGHLADPLTGGVPRATLQAIGGRRWAVGLVDRVLDDLVADGTLRGEDRLVRVTDETRRDDAAAGVLAVIDAAGLKGLTLQELESRVAGLDRKGLATVLGRLARTQDLERLGDLHVASRHLIALAGELRGLAAGSEAPATLEVGWFKERYGLTRKAAIPLLEWLDRTRVTRRSGEARVLVTDRRS